MRKFLHLYQTTGWYKCASLRMWFVIPYYHKIFIFAVLERWLIYDCETECSFVYLIYSINDHSGFTYIRLKNRCRNVSGHLQNGHNAFRVMWSRKRYSFTGRTRCRTRHSSSRARGCMRRLFQFVKAWKKCTCGNLSITTGGDKKLRDRAENSRRPLCLRWCYTHG